MPYYEPVVVFLLRGSLRRLRAERGFYHVPITTGYCTGGSISAPFDFGGPDADSDKVGQAPFDGKGLRCELSTGAGVTRLRKVFDLAKIPNGHAHRFRDRFAVELLLAGVPIERVSVLLGHSSIRVTERHYSPWVRSRQEQLEADIASAWSRDPMVLLEAKRTLEVHEKKRAVK